MRNQRGEEEDGEEGGAGRQGKKVKPDCWNRIRGTGALDARCIAQFCTPRGGCWTVANGVQRKRLFLGESYVCSCRLRPLPLSEQRS
eukprot:1837662-Rhodomonas_salina.1